MSARSNPVTINKIPSSENVCKFKEDRSRSGGNSHKFKPRNDNAGSSKHMANHSYQSGSNRGQINSYQKQPRSRSTWGGRRTKVTQAQREEMGGKKVNLNHLLNFTYEHEEPHYHASRYVPRWRNTTNHTLYNKEQFIQANCQLIMKEGEDYDMNFANFDLPIDWDKVEKLNIWREEIPTCPICLSDFCAARMTKCGHIYCWPCILHYLALDDKSWRKCPICHEAVHKKDLRSVSVYPEKRFKVQNLITMKLMKHQLGSTTAVSVYEDFPDTASFKFNEKLQASELRNHKYLIASSDQIMQNIVDVDQAQLQFKLATEFDEFEKSWIKAALELCNERAARLTDADKPAKEEATFRLSEKNVQSKHSTSLKPDKAFRWGSEDAASCEISSQAEVDSLKCDEASMQDESRVRYFYQSSDGQHIYLHPLNARCLFQQYGSYSHCPAEFSAKILECEEFSMNEDSRKRYRHLSHLPLSMEFRIVELDLRPPLVSMTTLESFQEALDRRAAFRRKKARDEKKILRRSQNEAMKKQGKRPEARICLENQQQFPQIQEPSLSEASYSVLLPSGTAPGNEVVSSSASVLGLSPVESAASSTSENGLSFAQMLKSSRSEEFPSWGRRVPLSRSAPSSDAKRTDEDDDDNDDDNFAAPPAFQSSFGDAISAALENMPPPSGGKKSRKGKKGKKMVLFSTSNQHC